MMAADTGKTTRYPAELAGRLTLIPVSLPLLFLQPLLGRVVRTTARRRPHFFERIGPHINKSFLIDPVNMPFALKLLPNPERPRLKAVRRRKSLAYDARIAGSFLSLLDMVDGHLDGDALFFSRDLIVEGDIEAVVCLRNALDDLDGSIADDIAAMFGMAGRCALSFHRKIRAQT